MTHLARLFRLLRPRRFGRYLVGERLGAGAMGEVHRAWDPRQRCFVALKTLSARATSEQRARFEREATLGLRVRHGNAVRVFERGTASDGSPFYTMELVEGCTLRELVEREGIPSLARVTDWLLQLCAALQAVHGAGLVHRDIKPENVLLARVGGREVVKLADFGLLRELAAPVENEAGTIVGTPLYLSPEAITAPERVGPKSDLYGLGALTYFLLTGEPVFAGSGLIEVCCQHLHAAPRALPGSAARSGLQRVVLECLAKDPEARPASAAALSARLEACERTETSSGFRGGALDVAA